MSKGADQENRENPAPRTCNKVDHMSREFKSNTFMGKLRQYMLTRRTNAKIKLKTTTTIYTIGVLS